MINASFIRLVAAAVILSQSTPLCHAERRGIVIGNRDYSDTGRFDDLATTLNDAALMHKLMTQAGFKMAPMIRDATRLGMEEALIQFCDGLNPGDEAVVYYAGHGVQFENKVYLMGTNAEFRIKSKLGEEAVSQETLAAMLGERGVKLAVLILDCCREVPDQSWLASANRTRGFRSSEAAALVPPPNILIGFATSSGRLTNDALRDTDANGPLVLALEKHWNDGLEFDQLWKAVARDVFTASRSVHQGTAELQMPSKYGQTIHDFYFVTSPTNTPTSATGSPPTPPTSPPKVSNSASMMPAIPPSQTLAPIPAVEAPLPPTLFDLNNLFDDTPFDEFNSYSRSIILRKAQEKLQTAGLYPMKVDGAPGPGTSSAIREWQTLKGLTVTGALDSETLKSLALQEEKEITPPIARQERTAPTPVPRVNAVPTFNGQTEMSTRSALEENRRRGLMGSEAYRQKQQEEKLFNR